MPQCFSAPLGSQSGGSTSYAYDTLNRLQTLTPPVAFTSGSFGLGYDALSRRTSLTRPNGVNTTYAYDNLSRLLSVLHKLGNTTLDGTAYTVDNAGNRTSKTDNRTGVTSNYAYDPIYELTQVTQGGATAESYSYDYVGNRLTSLGVPNYSYNVSSELTSSSNASYGYDANGNAVTRNDSSGITTFAWDYENRLTSVTLPGSGGTVTFKYDPLGRRIYKSSSSGTSVFAYDGDNLVEETNVSGVAVARYSQTENIDELLAEVRSGTTSYYEEDGLGSVTSLTNSAGAAAQTYTYDSFGNIVATTGSLTNSFRYTGREFDAETGLYYYRARYYDPAAGRFLSEDPFEFGAGINFYAYVGNDPQDWGDLDGTQRDRRTAGQPSGTPNPFKHMKPDPDDPTKVIYDDPHTGEKKRKAKPQGFDDYWNKKHPKPQPSECASAPQPPPGRWPEFEHNPGDSPFFPFFPTALPPVPGLVPVPILEPVLVF